MLVLQRDAGERIFVGDDVVITMVHSGGKFRIGVDAPPDTKIYREEVAPPDLQRKLGARHPKKGGR